MLYGIEAINGCVRMHHGTINASLGAIRWGSEIDVHGHPKHHPIHHLVIEGVVTESTEYQRIIVCIGMDRVITTTSKYNVSQRTT